MSGIVEIQESMLSVENFVERAWNGFYSGTISFFCVKNSSLKLQVNLTHNICNN